MSTLSKSQLILASLTIALLTTVMPTAALPLGRLAKQAAKITAATAGVATIAGSAAAYYEIKHRPVPALTKAVSKRNLPEVERLLATGADPNVSGPFGMRPLHAAIFSAVAATA
ncbi:MAG TPA: ankyrin repeat domain-containing protein, partial [Candidatus Babeliales bacterium]|nr:ankyrin repeat domain-containing protein [Candidatus Babeliales bacterium]